MERKLFGASPPRIRRASLWLLVLCAIALAVEARISSAIEPQESVELSLKVDLGCPANPATLKSGWTPWQISGGCDGKPHDGRALNNIAGTCGPATSILATGLVGMAQPTLTVKLR